MFVCSYLLFFLGLSIFVSHVSWSVRQSQIKGNITLDVSLAVVVDVVAIVDVDAVVEGVEIMALFLLLML